MFGNTPILRYGSRLSSRIGIGDRYDPCSLSVSNSGDVVLVAISGVGVERTIEASQDRIDTTNKLLIQTLNAETGVRGYC